MVDCFRLIKRSRETESTHVGMWSVQLACPLRIHWIMSLTFWVTGIKRLRKWSLWPSPGCGKGCRSRWGMRYLLNPTPTPLYTSSGRSRRPVSPVKLQKRLSNAALSFRLQLESSRLSTLNKKDESLLAYTVVVNHFLTTYAWDDVFSETVSIIHSLTQSIVIPATANYYALEMKLLRSGRAYDEAQLERLYKQWNGTLSLSADIRYKWLFWKT